jgi:low molecular weight protein-tyrosine phosphatase
VVAYRICLVCLGNICRSPMAEAVLRAKVGQAGLSEEVVVDSAGLGDWHVGDNADHRALAALTQRGYLLEHAARQFDAAWFAERDLVLALDRGNLRGLRRLAPDPATAERIRLLRSYDPEAGDDLDVPDPYYGGPEGFEHALDLVERACDGLVAQLRRTVGQR